MGKAPGTFASSLDCEVYHPLELPCSTARLCVVSLLRNGRSVASQTTSFLAAQQMSNEWVSVFIHPLFRHNQQQKSAHTSEKLSVITGISTRPLRWEGEGKKWCRTRRSIYITCVWFRMYTGMFTILPLPPWLVSYSSNSHRVSHCCSLSRWELC